MSKNIKYLREAIRFQYPLLIKYKWVNEIEEQEINATIVDLPGRIVLSGLPKQGSFGSDTSLIEATQHEIESSTIGGNRWIKIRNLLFVGSQIYVLPPGGPVLRLRLRSGLNSLKVNASQWAEIKKKFTTRMIRQKYFDQLI